jgi:hypothetical protein
MLAPRLDKLFEPFAIDRQQTGVGRRVAGPFQCLDLRTTPASGDDA